MISYVLITQSVVIIWLLILLGKTVHGFGKRIDRASCHLQMTDKPEDPKPICGCQHHQCFHDETGCHESSRIWNEETIKCGCLRYVGPEVLPTVLP